MHVERKLPERTHFGDKPVSCTQYLTKDKQITTFWEYADRLGVKSTILIHLVITPNKELIEARITDRTLGFTNNTIIYDKSAEPVQRSYPPGRQRIAEDYQAKLKLFLESVDITITPALPSAEKTFKNLAASGEGVAAKKEPEFSKVMKIQRRGSAMHVVIPTEIVRQWGLQDGQIAYWKILGDRFTLKTVKGVHENVVQVYGPGYGRLGLSIPRKIQKDSGFEADMTFKLEEVSIGDDKFIKLIPTKGEWDARIYGKPGDLRMGFSKSVSGTLIQPYMLLDWKIKEKESFLEILGTHPYNITIWEVEKEGSLCAAIPKRLIKDMERMKRMNFENCENVVWTMEEGEAFLRPILPEDITRKS